MPILDDRGTLVGVVEGHIPRDNFSGDDVPSIDNPTDWVLKEKLYYNSTGLIKSYVLDDNSGELIENLDANGLNIARSEFLPFGWTGMYKDRFTGHYHTHFREYDPIQGRWLSQDPAGYMDGLNLYGMYADVNGVDPYGLWGWDGDWLETLIDVVNPYSLLTEKGRAAIKSFYIESGGSQLKEMGKGVSTIFSTEIDDAYGQMNKQAADRYAKVMVMNNDTLLGATGTAVVTALNDITGGTKLLESAFGVDITGYSIDPQERFRRSLMGGSQALFITAGGTSLLKSVRVAWKGTSLKNPIFAGHGYWKGDYFIVPDEATVTIPIGKNVKMPDIMGYLIETDQLTSKYMSIFKNKIIGARTYLSGAKMPNYILQPGSKLMIRSSSVTVKTPTPLSDLVKSGSGHATWAACTVEVVPLPNGTFMLVTKPK